MNAFLHEDFLLPTKTARRLYHDCAAPLPIIDYHCHLDPRELADDRRFGNLGQLWVAADPYKHRAMRLAGVPERRITGDATDREKYDAWAATVPRALGSPLHHWTALELQRYFGIDAPLDPASADRIWQTANGRLAEPEFSARRLLVRRRVACVCTSDRLLDDLTPHAAASRPADGLRVLPSLRADDLVAIDDDDFPGWLRRLGAGTGIAVSDFGSFLRAVTARLDEFAAAGCRLSDHALDDFAYVSLGEDETSGLFARRLAGGVLPAPESLRLRSGLLRRLGAEYSRRGWILQLHLGALRRTSTRLRQRAGPFGGYATIGGRCDVASLCTWFDDLERDGALPRVILYPLDPADFVPLAVTCGSFAEDGVAGKLQLGPAWWFNDHAAGMRAHLEAVSSYSLLSTFIGMTTDSRSLLSMVRHEYFRRVLCRWLGEQVEAGAMPDDDTQLRPLVTALCHENARAALRL